MHTFGAYLTYADARAAAKNMPFPAKAVKILRRISPHHSSLAASARRLGAEVTIGHEHVKGYGLTRV